MCGYSAPSAIGFEDGKPALSCRSWQRRSVDGELLVNKLRRFRKKSGAIVTAVQVDLDTDGFSYRKWGGIQFCKPGDWLIENQDDTYTVDRESFEATYTQVSPGVYRKLSPVWADVAEKPGAIKTEEGTTHFEVGDYLVFNDEGRRDGYAVSAERFEAMYEPDENSGE